MGARGNRCVSHWYRESTTMRCQLQYKTQWWGYSGGVLCILAMFFHFTGDLLMSISSDGEPGATVLTYLLPLCRRAGGCCPRELLRLCREPFPDRTGALKVPKAAATICWWGEMTGFSGGKKRAEGSVPFSHLTRVWPCPGYWDVGAAGSGIATAWPAAEQGPGCAAL